jgi:hypothetical protein
MPRLCCKKKKKPIQGHSPHSAFNVLSLIPQTSPTYVPLSVVLRKSDSWFPEKIYYTATPQEVRDFRLESRRLIMTATATGLPLEDDIQEEAIDTDEPTENAVTADHQGLEKQQYWVDQLKEDMKADFKEELREQLEVQKKQSDEQIEQLQTQLGEILAVLRAGSKGDMTLK